MNSSSAVAMFSFFYIYTYNIRCLRLPILGSQIAAVAQLCKLYYILYICYLCTREIVFNAIQSTEQNPTADHYMITYYYFTIVRNKRLL